MNKYMVKIYVYEMNMGQMNKYVIYHSCESGRRGNMCYIINAE